MVILHGLLELSEVYAVYRVQSGCMYMNGTLLREGVRFRGWVKRLHEQCAILYVAGTLTPVPEP